MIITIKSSVKLLIILYVSIPHPSHSQSSLCNKKSTHLPHRLVFLPVSG